MLSEEDQTFLDRSREYADFTSKSIYGTPEGLVRWLRIIDTINPVGYVPVRLYSGGVREDGTTNTEPIDFLNPASPTNTENLGKENLRKQIIKTALEIYDCANDDPVCTESTLEYLMELCREYRHIE